MFGYFRKRREKRERAAELQQLGNTLGESLMAELDLFLEVEVKPKRAAFLEVFRGQLASLDERLAEAGAGEEVSRLEAASIDYRLLLENWQERRPAQMEQAHDWLREQFDLADAAGVRAEYEAAVENALNDQHLALMNDGLEVLMEMVPESRADYDSASHPSARGAAMAPTRRSPGFTLRTRRSRSRATSTTASTTWVAKARSCPSAAPGPRSRTPPSPISRLRLTKAASRFP
jgi:hypothetical protein